MKVIGEAGEESYIVQMSSEELANVLGFYSKYDADLHQLIKQSRNGTNIPISSVYQNYFKVKGIVESSDYDKARTKLNEMLNALKPIEELVTKLKVEYEAN